MKRGRLRRRSRDSRGAAELLVTAVVAALIAGVFLGTGFAQIALNATDGLTWLGDPARGEVVQINPSTGRPESRLTVTPPGNGLAVAQADGLLVVTDTTTGVVTVIDVATLTTSGRFRGTGLSSTAVLLTGTDLYVADRATGRITRLDPGTAAPVGRAWSSDRGLADAVIDGSGTVWALDVTGTLYRLTWAPAALTLVESAPAREITGAGPDSVLVAHAQGVTAFAPEGRKVTQVGATFTDTTLPVSGLAAPLLAPVAPTPSDFVPVSMPDDDAVALFVDHAHVQTVSTAALGCTGPGAPAVHIDAAYIPCDTGKVIVLSRDGGHVDDIAMPDGDQAILTVHNDQLFVNAPGGETAVMIDEEGHRHESVTFDETIDSRDPDDAEAFTTLPEPDRDPDRSGGGSTSDGTGTGSGTGSGAGSSRSPSLAPPANVVATAQGVLVTVTWSHPGGADGFEIRTEAGAVVGSVDQGDATSAVVNMGQPGMTARYVVRALRGAESADSAPSDPNTTTGSPLPPSSVGMTFAPNGGAVDVTVTWPASQPRGAPVTGYHVEVRSGTGTPPIDTQTRDVLAPATSVTVTLSCGSQCAAGVPVAVTVEAQTENDGTSGATSATAVYTAPPPPLPQNGDRVVVGFDEEEACNWRQNPSCPNMEFDYTVNLSPPQSWQDFPGSCAIQFAPLGGGTPTERAITCGATRHYFGLGNGATYTVTVRACDGSCVISNSFQMDTKAPERVWCGTFMC